MQALKLGEDLHKRHMHCSLLSFGLHCNAAGKGFTKGIVPLAVKAAMQAGPILPANQIRIGHVTELCKLLR